MASLAPLPKPPYTEYITKPKNSVCISNALDIFSTSITILLVGMKLGLDYDTERTRYLAMYLSQKASNVIWGADRKSQLSKGMIPTSLVISGGGTGGRFKTGLRYTENGWYVDILEGEEKTDHGEANGSFLEVLEREAREFAMRLVVVGG
jgi:hypothetical protein